MALLLFWFSFTLLAYVYVGYPLLVTIAGRLRVRSVQQRDIAPRVSILISAYNEARHIEATVRNKIELDYPASSLEVIVISDGSTDGTDAIVQRLEREFPGRVRLLVQNPRQGKTAALNRAVSEASGEILVFSDANSLYERDALRRLIRNFADPQVGYVSGKMLYGSPGDATVGEACSAYMRYENFLREQETRIGSIVGVDGGIDAVRKILYRAMRPDQLPDFVLPLGVVEQGYRVVYEPDAVLREEALKSARDEYRMRVRVSLRALWALWDMRQLLSPRRDRLFAWQLLSHKWLRYLAFAFMLGAVAANAALWDVHEFYRWTLAMQAAFYLAALAGYLLDRIGRQNRLFFIPYYFVLINVGAAHACGKFLAGQKQVLWNPRAG